MNDTALNGIANMAGTSRVWIFQSSTLMEGEIKRSIEQSFQEFLAGWAAHGSSLAAGFEIVHDRFLVLAVDESVAMATGCSIDKMMKLVQHVDDEFHLDLLNRMKVAYIDNENVVECDVNSFREMLEAGTANAQTRVFNNLVQSLAEYRAGWETTVAQSWHANLLP